MKQESLKFSGRASNPATSKGALEKSIFFQKMVLKESKDPKQKERAKKAIEKLQAELDSLMERKTNPATKKFSPAQIAAQKLFAERARAGTLGKTAKRKTNPDKDKPNVYIKRVSQATGAPPTKRLVKRRTKALFAPAGYFPNPKAAAMMPVYQVVCMHPKKHVVGIFKTMAEAKQIATAMANANNVPYAIKTHMVQKAHFAP